ncbi:hypothetical protein PMIN03_011484 [Paraphaeosphaeria minitans]
MNVVTPWAIGTAIDELSLGPGKMPWKQIVIWSTSLFLDSRAGIDVPDRLASNYIQGSSDKQVSQLAMRHIMKLDFKYHSDKNTGEILKRVDQSGSLNSLVELVIFQILPVVLDFIVAVVYVTKLFGTYLTLPVIGISAVYILLVTILNFWKQKKQRIYVEAIVNKSKVAYEVVSNWTTVTLFGRTEHEETQYATAVQDLVDASYNLLYRVLWGNALQDLIMTGGFVCCTILAMRQVALGNKSVGTLVNFMLYWNAIRGTIKQLTGSYEAISSTLVNAEGLLRLLKTKPSVTDSKLAKELVVDAGEVTFKNVSFGYDSRKLIIDNVSFTAEAGKTTAIVGATGCGKSTLFTLLLRLYDVRTGSITIDGQDIRDVTQSSLRKAIGSVPQQPHLFNRSILENVRYGNFDASDEYTKEECKAAASHDCITGFPDGYETKAGEGRGSIVWRTNPAPGHRPRRGEEIRDFSAR